jgi:hypothetical protein
MSTLAQTFVFVFKCTPLAFSIPWSRGSCFGHAFSKTWQYACNDINVCVGFHEVSLKATQSMLYKKLNIKVQQMIYQMGKNKVKGAIKGCG